MEVSLRELIAKNPTEEFRGVYLEGGLNPTRKNVLVPGALGVYTGGSNYNPAQVSRDPSVQASTAKIDQLLAGASNKTFVEMPIADLQALIALTVPDDSAAERVWDQLAISESIGQYAKIKKQTHGFVYVDRDRDLQSARHESQGILSGGEVKTVPDTHVTLFLLRTTAHPKEESAWWPQIRFPSGKYAFAFSI